MVLDSFFRSLAEEGLFADILTKIIVAAAIVLIGFIIGRIIWKISHMFLHEIELDKLLKKIGLRTSFENLISNLARYIVYLIFMILALNELGITSTFFNVIIFAIAVFIAISLILAIKDFIPNFISGLMILSRSKPKKGDRVKGENLKGTVVDIGIIDIKVKTAKGDILHIPNISIIKKEVS